MTNQVTANVYINSTVTGTTIIQCSQLSVKKQQASLKLTIQINT